MKKILTFFTALFFLVYIICLFVIDEKESIHVVLLMAIVCYLLRVMYSPKEFINNNPINSEK
jgi:hypothetical protein